METNTKIMIGVGVVGAVGLAWYLSSKTTTPAAAQTTAGAAAAAKPLLAQGAAAPGAAAQPTPAAAAQPTQVLMTSDGTASVTVPVGTVLAPTSSVGNNWDPSSPLVSSTAGVLNQTGPSTFVATTKGGTVLSGNATTSDGSIYPMQATVIVV